MLLELDVVEGLLQLGDVLDDRVEMLCTREGKPCFTASIHVCHRHKKHTRNVTGGGVLIGVSVVADEDIEIYSLVKGGFVGEAEVVDAFSLSHELVFVAYLVVKLSNLLPTWSLYLPTTQSILNISESSSSHTHTHSFKNLVFSPFFLQSGDDNINFIKHLKMIIESCRGERERESCHHLSFV